MRNLFCPSSKNLRFKTVLVVIALVFSFPLTLCSCQYVNQLTDSYTQMLSDADEPETSIHAVDDEGEVNFTSLLALFEDKGYTVSWEEADPIFLSGSRRLITFNDEDFSLNVFIYPDNDEAALEAACFSLDGQKFDTVDKGIDITWNSDPHLYLYDRIIILYVGTEESVISLCENLFGEQFAGV